MSDKKDQAQLKGFTSLGRNIKQAGPGRAKNSTTSSEQIWVEPSTENIDDLFHQAQRRQFELEVQNEQLRLWTDVLEEVFRALTTQTSHKAALNEVLRQLQRVVPYSAANIMLLRDGILRLVCWQGYNGSQEPLSTLEQSLAEFPLDAKVVQSQQPLIVPDTHQEPDWVVMDQSSWIRSFIAIPIYLHEQVLGLLRLDGDIPQKFLPEDVERLHPLVNAVAIALQNVWLQDQPRSELVKRVIQAETEIIQLNRKLLTLQYAGATISSGLNLQYGLDTVAKEIANLLKVESSAIFEWDQVTNIVSVIAKHGLNNYGAEGPLAEAYSLAQFPLIQRVLVERRPQQIIIRHPGIYPAELAYMQKARIKTLLMVPMEFQDRVVGLVKIMEVHNKRIFTNKEIGLVQLLGNQVASVLENTRLYEQVQQQLAERIEIEQDLRLVATRQQAILNAIPDSMFYFNRNGKLLDYKIVDTYKSLGILNAQLIRENSNDVPPTNLVDLIRRYINQQRASDKMQFFEYQLLLPEGPQDFEIRLVPSGRNEVLAIVRNITERRQMEKTLAEERNLLRTLIDNQYWKRH